MALRVIIETHRQDITKKYTLANSARSTARRRWILGSGVLGYWLGSYELEKQTLFASFIKPGDVVFDVGAQAGFYTLWLLCAWVPKEKFFF